VFDRGIGDSTRYGKLSLAGRAAEELVFQDFSTGAENDIEQATKIARKMVMRWGMSEKLGPISYESDSGLRDLMYIIPGEREYSEKTAEEIDSEVKKLVDEAYKKARELIEANKDKLDKIAKTLLKYETLDADDVKLILEGGELDKPTVSDLLVAEQAKNKNPAQQNPLYP